jgi:hypothetical protein
MFLPPLVFLPLWSRSWENLPFFKSGELLNLRRVRRGLKGKAWVGFACRAGTAGVENARAIVRRPCDLKNIMRISLDRRLV